MNRLLSVLVVIPLLFQDYSAEMIDSIFDKICYNALILDKDVDASIRATAKQFKIPIVLFSPAVVHSSRPNSIYVIDRDIDLHGETIIFPKNTFLYFRDGVLKNGKLRGNNTRVISRNRVLFKRGVSKYRGFLSKGDYHYVSQHNGSVVLEGSWSNKYIGEKWADIDSDNRKECQALAINNFIILHSESISQVVIPFGRYYVYDWIRADGYSIDFSGSEVLSIDFDEVQDLNLRIPDQTTPVPLRSRYGLLDINAKQSVIRNLTIDGRCNSRSEEPEAGKECLITIANNSGGSLENVILKNALCCAICTGEITDYTFNNVTIDWCGEHGIYTHAYTGGLSFNNCVFKNCGQDSRLVGKKKSIAGCIRGAGSRNHSPKEMNGFKAFFKNCLFTTSSEGINVSTIYTDIPNADFLNCRWENKVVGYVTSDGWFNDLSGEMNIYEFYNCDNPCSGYNSINTIRRLYNCTNVKNPFKDTDYITGSSLLIGYSDAVNQYSDAFIEEKKRPLQVLDCVFFQIESNLPPRSVIINSRPIRFVDCRWPDDAKYSEQYKDYSCLYIKTLEGGADSCSSVEYIRCGFMINRPVLDCINTSITFDSCYFSRPIENSFRTDKSSRNTIIIR